MPLTDTAVRQARATDKAAIALNYAGSKKPGQVSHYRPGRIFFGIKKRGQSRASKTGQNCYQNSAKL